MKNLADLLTTLSRAQGRPKEEEEEPAEERCLSCGFDLSKSELYRRYRVCEQCRFHFNLSARQRIDLLTDAGSFKEVNRSLASLDPLSFSGKTSYRKLIFEAQGRTGLVDAAVTGLCSIEGKPTVIVALDFGFMAGSMGCVVGEKIAKAFELAERKKLPVVSVVASGGARIQEGILALMQMAKTAAAVQRHGAAGLPYLSVLANPATGEAYASFANLGDIIVAEPKALVGFAALRVLEEATGKPLPAGSHTTEFHLNHGMLDTVVDRTKLKDLLGLLLELTSSRYRLMHLRRQRYQLPEPPRDSAWQTVQLARHGQRPTTQDYLCRLTSSFIELHGDRLYGDDSAIVCGLADLSGLAVVIIGQERGKGEEAAARREGRTYPEGFRKAQRAMRLAAKFGLPVLTFIDTPGAYPGLEAEERGMGGAIASTLALMSDLPVPLISVVIGEGGAEGALALGVADRTLMLENAIYSIISPEGAAALLFRDVKRAEEIAASLKLTAHDCRELGVIDVVVPEPEGGAHVDHDEAARILKKVLLDELVELQRTPAKRLVKNRYRKFRKMGEYNSFFSAAIAREVFEVQDYFQRRFEELRDRLARQ
ncbi:MAG: acetyl-CoA carboxylase carboxyl transferase subunit beta [Chloroflexi bacterium]|nr:acetyl-CoA carboxylase carboxyl transferase subunit beta [Chloroflexota bacterium]